jgi:hypothetical protein
VVTGDSGLLSKGFPDMTHGYVYDHEWALERTRLAGLEAALDAGTQDHLARWRSGSPSASHRAAR